MASGRPEDNVEHSSNPPVRWVAGAALVPGALTAYLGFHAGGFFPAATGLAAAAMLGLVFLLLTFPERPWSSISAPWVVLVAALVVLAGLELLSARWSHATGRAVLESDRTLLYLAGGVAGGLVGRRPNARAWLVRGLAAGAVAVCVGGFVSRTLPDVLHVALTNHPERLSYPVTYWNAMGFMAALALVLCTGLASDCREPALVRVLATISLPLTAPTLLLTYSRGPIGLCIGALVLFAVVGRPRGLPGALLAAAGPTALALVSAYGAGALGSDEPQSALAVDQGMRVALIVAGCCLAAGALRLVTLRLDAVLARRPPWPVRRRRAATVVLAGLLGAAAAVLLITGVAGRQYDRFVHAAPTTYTDQRDRLLDVGNNGRVSIWHVAWRDFRSEPAHGIGAGTFSTSWDRQRPSAVDVNDAHSLYLETLGELGVLGALVILVALGAGLFGLIACVHRAGDARTLPAAVLAAAAMWLAHAGIDWDWEMPVTTLWLFVLSGAALAATGRQHPMSQRAPGRLGRILASLACLLVIVTPVRVALSQQRLDDGVQAFLAGDCRRATDEALSSLNALPVRAEPWELIAYCDARAGQGPLAEHAMREARRRDLRNWELAYGLAIVHAAASHDPRPAAKAALRLNPRESRAQLFAQRVAKGDTTRWRRAARDAPLPVR